MVFLLYELYDIAEIAIQYGTDFRQNLCTDMLVLAQLGKGGRRHAGSQTQILLFHVFIDQELPQFIIANSHFSPLILHMLEQLMRPKVSA